MEGRFIIFFGGIVLMIALFVPLTELQDSGSASVVKRSRGGGKGRRCTPFQQPHAVVGRYQCLQKLRKSSGQLHSCKLICPPSMQVRPKKHRILHRCHKGRWTVWNGDVHCVATRSVSLVEQHLAPPQIINRLLTSYLNDSYNYLAMAYFLDRADVNLPGFHEYFLGLWRHSLDMGRDIMAYINKRGGWIDMQDLPRSRLTELLHIGLEEGHVGLVAMEAAITMEKHSQGLVLELMERVQNHRVQDPHLLHTLEHKHLAYKVKIVKELMDRITRLRAFQQTEEGDYELGEYEMDSALA